MPGKKIIGSGSTENKVIRLADHVAGLETGGGGLPRFVQAVPTSFDLSGQVFNHDRRNINSMILLTEGKISDVYRLDKDLPFFSGALNANDFFNFGFDSFEEYIQFEKAAFDETLENAPPPEMGAPNFPEPKSLRYLLNYNFQFLLDVASEKLQEQPITQAIGLDLNLVYSLGKGDKFYFERIGILPCVMGSYVGKLMLSGSGSAVINFPIYGLGAIKSRYVDSPQDGNDFCGLSLTVSDDLLDIFSLGDVRGEINAAKIQSSMGELSGDYSKDINFFNAAIVGPEVNQRFNYFLPPDHDFPS